MANQNRSNLTLWLILGICVAPFAVAIALFTFWTPKNFVNYGELLEPRPFKEFFVPPSKTVNTLMKDIRGRWALVVFDGGDCSKDCQTKLYWIRQLRLTQGRERDRLERVWFVTNDIEPNSGLVREFSGTRIINLPRESSLFQPPDGLVPEDNIFLLDTYGNLMMRYPDTLEPDKVKTDLKKLLKISKGLKYRNRDD